MSGSRRGRRCGEAVLHALQPEPVVLLVWIERRRLRGLSKSLAVGAESRIEVCVRADVLGRVFDSYGVGAYVIRFGRWNGLRGRLGSRSDHTRLPAEVGKPEDGV